jgi:hypothetical protein
MPPAVSATSSRRGRKSTDLGPLKYLLPLSLRGNSFGHDLAPFRGSRRVLAHSPFLGPRFEGFVAAEIIKQQIGHPGKRRSQLLRFRA